MGLMSKTGLVPSAGQKQQYAKAKGNREGKAELSDKDLQQLCEVTPAPFMLRPYAGLYNPFSLTCSVLCNHPADKQIRASLKKAKNAMTSECRTQHYGEDFASFPRFSESDIYRSPHDIVTEDMLKRYTQTDSRPLTPAPTLASGKSRGSRRCLTPDQPYPKTAIVVDLRRSHSQETISYYHGYSTDMTSTRFSPDGLGRSRLPSINTSEGINHQGKWQPSSHLPPLESPLVLIKRANVNEPANAKNGRKEKTQLKALNLAKPAKGKTKQGAAGATRGSKENRDKSKDKAKDTASEPSTAHTQADDDAAASSTDMRRRGKRRRKGRMVGSDRLTSAGLAAQSQPDPETQIAGIGTDSNNASSRGSISAAPGATLADDNDDKLTQLPTMRKPVVSKKSVSFLDDDILKFLHREVDEEAIETEFDIKRRYVLKEALRTRPDRPYGEEMQSLIKEMNVPAVCLGDWLHIPRVFSRNNVQFSLPIDYTELQTITPMQYAARFVTFKKSKQLLYLTVLRKFRPEGYRMPIKHLEEGLILMMGGILTKELAQRFKVTMDWEKHVEQENMPDEIILKSLEEGYKDDKGRGDSEPEPNTIKFRTWCGLCGICERMYGRFPSREDDMPDGIEMSDFTMIEAKLTTLQVHSGLLEIIYAIKHR